MGETRVRKISGVLSKDNIRVFSMTLWLLKELHAKRREHDARCRSSAYAALEPHFRPVCGKLVFGTEGGSPLPRDLQPLLAEVAAWKRVAETGQQSMAPTAPVVS